jgi:tetraacyldisaccharide 4'-kinase
VDYIVTTEKDAVRIPDGMPCPVPIFYLRLEIEILHGAANFDEAVGRICFPPDAPSGVGADLPSPADIGTVPST